MKPSRGGGAAIFFCSLAVFWPGAIIFGLPGTLGPHWQAAFEVGRMEVGRSLFFLLAGAGSCMYVAGRFQERVGPRRLTALGAALTGGSTALLAGAESIAAVYAWAYCVGAASALVYIPALTVAQLWYPHRRGLVSGFVNMVFGMAAALVAPLTAHLQLRVGYEPALWALGAATAAMGLAASVFIRLPSPLLVALPGPAPATPLPPSLSVSESLRTRTFWLLYLSWAFAGAGGITMVVFSTAYGTARGLPIQEAVLLLSSFGLTNGLGRLASGMLSDRFGRSRVMAAAYLAAAAAYGVLPNADLFATWAVCTAVIGFAFGTQFAVSAPLIIDCFGIGSFGAIFGAVFTAYGFFSGILGPWIGGLLLDGFQGDFGPVFYYLGFFYLVAAGCVWRVGTGAGASPPAGRGVR
jgi:OFA family oxalate/formate antiporter-like MFS transporter